VLFLLPRVLEEQAGLADAGFAADKDVKPFFKGAVHELELPLPPREPDLARLQAPTSPCPAGLLRKPSGLGVGRQAQLLLQEERVLLVELERPLGVPQPDEQTHRPPAGRVVQPVFGEDGQPAFQRFLRVRAPGEPGHRVPPAFAEALPLVGDPVLELWRRPAERRIQKGPPVELAHPPVILRLRRGQELQGIHLHFPEPDPHSLLLNHAGKPFFQPEKLDPEIGPSPGGVPEQVGKPVPGGGTV